MPDGLSELMSECEEAQHFERSAALAVFHGDLRAAVLVSKTSAYLVTVQYEDVGVDGLVLTRQGVFGLIILV